MSLRGQEKLIKDNVHGYIYIDKEYFKIIDTAIFQRLKNVKQTSYMSLYPSSSHDRFIHSLGTYHLGKTVMEELWKNLGDSFDSLFKKEDKEQIRFTFEMACLLHDVGHAPFSHTGEDFYIVKQRDNTLKNDSYFERYSKDNKITLSYIDGLLINELQEAYQAENLKENPVMAEFLEDYVARRGNETKPHEKMSALIGLRSLLGKIREIASNIYGAEERFNADLFVRCIIGAKYKTIRSGDGRKRYSFYNAIISLLNSDIIDVDKLDYMLRDNLMTGYDNTSIDIDRLIKSFTIYSDGDYCQLAYKKNALSVIENVVRAHDASRRWIQNHPIILYDMYITQKCVAETFKLFQEKYKNSDTNVFESFFSIESISAEGKEWAPNENVFLASDLDVISLIKRAYVQTEDSSQKALFEEFFARDKRRHPLWKSEIEFKECFALQCKNNTQREEIFSVIKDAVATIITCKDKNTGVGEYIFNEDTYDQIKENIPREGRKFLNTIRKYFQSIQKHMDIVILAAPSFSSKMKKLNTSAVNLVMPDYCIDGEKRLYRYSDLFEGDGKDITKSDTVFYIYSKCDIDTKDFIRYLLTMGTFEA